EKSLLRLQSGLQPGVRPLKETTASIARNEMVFTRAGGAETLFDEFHLLLRNQSEIPEHFSAHVFQGSADEASAGFVDADDGPVFVDDEDQRADGVEDRGTEVSLPS